MNLSFSTRGWRNLPWHEQIQDAVDNRFQGIEVYNLPEAEALVSRNGPFHRYNQNDTIRQLKQNHLTIPCFDTSFDLSTKEISIEKASDLIDTASNMRVRYVAFCALNDEAARLLNAAVEKLRLSMRAYQRILKVARTVADLEGEDKISSVHIAEAIQYRELDQKYWR